MGFKFIDGVGRVRWELVGIHFYLFCGEFFWVFIEVFPELLIIWCEGYLAIGSPGHFRAGIKGLSWLYIDISDFDYFFLR